MITQQYHTGPYFDGVIPFPQKQYSEPTGPLEKYVAANDNRPVARTVTTTGGSYIGLTRRAGDYMQVFSGRKFWPCDPRADEVHIEDIAHSLSLQCRYAGHCIQFYSVAEHSVHVAHWLLQHYGPLTAMHGLLHDATEAYCVDVPRPLKPSLANYKEIEDRIWVAIAKRFDLSRELPAVVKEADDRIIADELVNMRPMEWHARYSNGIGAKIGCWSPDAAEDEFLATFVRLQRKLGRA